MLSIIMPGIKAPQKVSGKLRTCVTRSILVYGSDAPKMSFLARLWPAITRSRSSFVRSVDPAVGVNPRIRFPAMVSDEVEAIVVELRRVFLLPCVRRPGADVMKRFTVVIYK